MFALCGSQRLSCETAACKELEMSFSLSYISALAACSGHFNCISSSHLNGFQSKHPILLQGESLFSLSPVKSILTEM